MSGKVCTKCRRTKPIAQFHRRGKGKERHQHCRDCRRNYFKSWYKSLPPEQRATRNERAKLAMRKYRAKQPSKAA
jgi:hypothetical protein